MTRIDEALRALATGGVQFILAGGAAAAAHGSARVTQDVDLVYCRTEANIERLVNNVGPF